MPGEAEAQRKLFRPFRVGARGSLVIGPAVRRGRAVARLAPEVAPQMLADQLVTAQLFGGPRVCLKAPGMTAPACADAKTTMPRDAARAYLAFKAYIKGTQAPADALARYHQWVSDHLSQPDFTKVPSPDLWTESLKQAARPADPQAEQVQMRLWVAQLRVRIKLRWCDGPQRICTTPTTHRSTASLLHSRPPPDLYRVR